MNIEDFFKKSFIRNVSILSASSVIGLGCYTLLTPLFTRLYTPDDFARFGVLLSFIGMFNGIVGLRFESAIVGAKEDGEGICLIIGAIASSFIIAPLLGSLTGFLILNDVLSFGTLPLWSCVAVVILLLVNGMQVGLRAMLVRTNAYKIVGKVVVYQGIGRALSTLLFGFLNPSWIGLYVGEVLGKVIGLRVQVAIVVPQVFKFMKNHGVKDIKHTLSSYWRYPMFAVPSTLIDSAAAALPIPIVNHFFGLASAGYFTFVQKILVVPVAVFGSNIADVFHSELADCARSDPDKMLNVFFDFTKKLAIVAFVPTTLLMGLSPFLTGIIFGSEWGQCGPLITVLAPMMFVGLIVSPLSRSILVIHRPEVKFFYDVIGLLATLLSLTICRAFAKPLLYTIGVYSASHCVAYLAYYFICLHAILNYRNKCLKDEN